MGIKANFTQLDVEKRVLKFIQTIEKRIVKRLQYLGEMCVTHAREIPPEVGFGDVTGNLRSSIGYLVFKDGVAVHEGFEGNTEGAATGKALAKKIGSQFPVGFALVVVAGMNYAVHVESRGKDVLTSAEILAQQELPKMLEKLKNNINKSLE